MNLRKWLQRNTVTLFGAIGGIWAFLSGTASIQSQWGVWTGELGVRTMLIAMVPLVFGILFWLYGNYQNSRNKRQSEEYERAVVALEKTIKQMEHDFEGTRLALKVEMVKVIGERIHNIAHDFRNIMFDVAWGLKSKDCPSGFDTFVQNLLDQLAALFTALTSDPCSACIKFVTPIDGKDTVITYKRDRDSEKRRQGIDSKLPSYDVTDFTPFDLIINGELFDPPVFFTNDLLRDMKDPNFRIHPERRNAIGPEKIYNAICCWPIRFVETGQQPRCYAILCVDNRIGSFSHQYQYVGGAVADLICFALVDQYQALRVLSSKKTNK